MRKRWWLITLVACLALAILSPLASSHPDGLERVAEDQGFFSLAREAPVQIMADYLFPGIHNEALSTILAGTVGTLLVFFLMWGIAWLVKSRRSPADNR